MKPTLEQIQAEQLKRIKAQINRLRESVERMASFSAVQLDSRLLRKEYEFAEQVVDALQTLTVSYHHFAPIPEKPDTCSICAKAEPFRAHV